MNTAGLLLLGIESLVLAGVVLTLFRLRRRIGLTPLYVMLGVFQPVQVMLSSAIFVEPLPGVPVSPGTLMFAASLLAVLLVYIREDAAEARKVTYGVLGANVAMTLILFVAGIQVQMPGAANLLQIAPGLFTQGARVTAVGTLVLLADVVLLIVLYSLLRGRAARRPLLRVWATLTGVLVFDAVAFTTGAFGERADYSSLLSAGVMSKLVVGTFFSIALTFYLRRLEPADLHDVAPEHPLRDFFYAFTWRDRFELQAQHHARERAQVFERITDAFVALDRNWRYTFVNSKAAQMFGRRPEDLIGRHIWTEFPEGEHEAFAEAYRQAMTDQQPRYFEAYYPPYDRWFENRIYPSPDGLTIYFHDITDRVQRRNELLHRASHDELTGLPNRRAMRERIDGLLAERADARPLGVIVLNLDRLHHVNDTLGYAAGDRVLVEVAQRLLAWAERSGWQVGSIGGDEFLLVHDAHGPRVLDAIAHEAIDVVTQPYAIGEQSVYLTCSAGASWFPAAGRGALQLLQQADLALNVAKQRGRNKVCLFSEERAADIRERLQLTTRIRDALERDAFELHYQPLVDTVSGRIVGAEALMRWHDAELGPVGPARFIPIAEDAGLIVRLGHWALRRALGELHAWQAAGLRPVPLSVNVSALQFQRAEFAHELAALVREAGVAPELLKLEITESVLMEDTARAVAMLDALRRLGVRVSLDDFGTGHSSLAQLRELPLDEIKIDRSFVRDAGTDGFGATLCRAIVGLGRELRFTVVAEGVETAAEASFLAEAGCPVLQGFLFSRPLPAPALRELLAADAGWTREGLRRPPEPAPR